MCRIQNTSKIKLLVAAIALSYGLSAVNHYTYREEQPRRTARTSYTKKPAPFETKKSTSRSFLCDLDLFVKVLLSGPFGLYHGWRTRKHK